MIEYNFHYKGYSIKVAKVFFWVPEEINGQWYWLKSRWVEREKYIIHGKSDGCSNDIWTTRYVRVVPKLERALA